jgi:hypothetical protein
MTAHWTDKLVTMGGCEDGIAWARQYESAQAAWDACMRADWMEWLMEATGRAAPAEYERSAYSAWKEYYLACNVAQAEYCPTHADVWGDYDRLCDICDSAWVECDRVCAVALRSYVPVCPLSEEVADA